ncbi:mannose-1-phosphate guanylyltransferase/mannose-6-phosphate isomerase [Ideonella sp.]|jgi:mannose-1-phosphate guanylyltransferase/mannose-6-phosphate isomerase|uniref:mannose-1-phosphate guanylyltransferase/mannose-6-phosphate isomerase n=1 Tax=Ideonella sp. TaxID=1929293 RepID=UPI0037C0A12A
MSKSLISICPVVMAGGSGTRLWPLSRAGFPKQFLALSGETTLFQQAVERLMALEADDIAVSQPVIVGNAEHRFMVREQLLEIDVDPLIMLEPSARNTAPAMTLAALQASVGHEDPVLVVSPSDQTIGNDEAFTQALQLAVRTAATGAFVILGVTPDRPETGYGYIRSNAAAGGVASVAEFVEKPDAATAARYLAEGHYTWNSGMFVVKASVWLAALEAFRPDILKATQASWDARKENERFIRPSRAEFEHVPSESVDYAVLERCPGSAFDIRMVPLNAAWNDLGAWDAVWMAAARDARGNASQGDVMIVDSDNTLIHATSRLVGAVGLKDVIVVETPDAVLVTDRSRSQDVKKIVAKLGERGRIEHALHRKVHRPWGWYDSIDMGPRFQVKRIMVRPGASLSLQMHHHRAEHWIVVTGTAEVTCGEKKILLTENQSTYIPLGEVHRLANPGRVDLEIIEVQSGSYLGEDDIVRFEDTYGRTAT